MIETQQKRLTTREAAEYLGIAEQTLVIWRSTKQQRIPYFKIGGKISYVLADLEAFLESCRKVESGPRVCVSRKKKAIASEAEVQQ